MKRILTLTLILLALTSCASPPPTGTSQTQPTPITAPTNTPQANMPNPASVYCEQQGNRLEIRTAADGSQFGVCIFPDGSECDEWAYFRGECGPASQATDTPAIPTQTSTASLTSDSSLFLTMYTFPRSIDSAKRYLFYLHGRIIEDQGIPAVSPEYGEYEYEVILGKLASHGFTIISEQRSKNADGMKYAERVAGQVAGLLNAGVPTKNITVVGASKGASIVIAVSSFLANKALNFVLLGTCNPETVQFSKQQNLFLYGNVLTIRDSADGFAGSCEELFVFSEGKIARHEEIVLDIGTGHGILYKPLDKWILPTVQWAQPELKK